MSDFATEAMAGVRAALIAAPGVAALIGDRVVDEPRADLALPYIRFARVEPAADDTDGTLGGVVQMGLEIHSRPGRGQVEALMVCQAIHAAVHRQPAALVGVGMDVIECEVQTWAVDRQKDGVTYLGRLALEVHLQA